MHLGGNILEWNFWSCEHDFVGWVPMLWYLIYYFFWICCFCCISGGHCGQWRRWKKLNDTAILQRHLYKRLQKNHWSGLFRKTNRVSMTEWNDFILSNFIVKLFGVFFDSNRIDGEDIRVMLWDTAGMLLAVISILKSAMILMFYFKNILTGQEEFDAITKAYYRGAQACVLAFSTTDRMSFEAVKEWKMKVKST